MGVCLSICSSEGPEQPGNEDLDSGTEKSTPRGRSLKITKEIQRLLLTTARHVESADATLPATIEAWGTNHLARVQRDEEVDTATAFLHLVEDIGPASRTLAVLKAMSQGLVLRSVGFVFQQCGLLALTNSVPSDVHGSWQIEIDFRDPSCPRVTHHKAQGKPHQQVSLQFALTLQLRQAVSHADLTDPCNKVDITMSSSLHNAGPFEVASVQLSITDFVVNADLTITPAKTAVALKQWHARTAQRLAVLNEGFRVAEEGASTSTTAKATDRDDQLEAYCRGMGTVYDRLCPRLGSTPHDIYRLAHAVSFILPENSPPIVDRP